MKNSKQFYKDLPRVNGFKWSFYDDGLHCFTKGSNRGGFISCYLSENDVRELPIFEFMLSYGLSRSVISGK